MLFDVFLLKKCKIEELDFYESFYISILRKRLVNIENGGKKNKNISDSSKKKISKKLKEYFSKNKVIHKVAVYNLDGTLYKIFDNTSDTGKYFNISYRSICRCCKKDNTLCCGYQMKYVSSDKKIHNVKKIYGKNEECESHKSSFKTYYKDKVGDELIKVKHVYSYTLDGTFIEEIPVVKMTYKFFNEIINVINKKRLTYHNKQWSLEFLEKIPPVKSRYGRVSEKLSYLTLQYDKDGNLIKEWENAKIAGKTLGINPNNIQQVCVGKRKKCGGFIWKYHI